MSWGMVKLKDCCKVVGGATPKREVKEYWNSNDFPWVTPKDVSKMTSPILQDAPEYISKKGYDACATFLLPKGSVLFTSRAPIGNVAIAGKDMCTNQGFKSLIPGDAVDGLYLYYCMLANAQKIEALGNGATFKEVSKKTVEEFSIPLPYPDDPEKSLKEQKRIAAILDKADGIRRKRQQAIQLADEFLRSVFLDMFGDPVTNPKGWEVKSVGKICDCIVPGRDKPKSFTGRTPWVTTNDLEHLGITNQPKEFIGLSDSEISDVKAKIVPTGSVLMTCVGDLGVVSIAGKDMVINQQLHAFLPNDSIDPFFLSYALSFQKGYMTKMASNTTVPYMNKTICNSVPIILPSIDNQKDFADLVQKTTNIEGKFTYSEDNALFNSLSQKAFKGEL